MPRLSSLLRVLASPACGSIGFGAQGARSAEKTCANIVSTAKNVGAPTFKVIL
jgi:hypothetical protein